MLDIECFLKEKLSPLYHAHYALWVYWWPFWRKIAGRKIMRFWEEGSLVREGQTFLDYGCGTGAFTIPAAKKVGSEGKVYALDCFPRQLEIVAVKSREAGLNNIETILSGDKTGLPGECADVIWVCDVLHEIRERRAVLEELHRVLKRGGVLVVYDGMKERITNYTAGLFHIAARQGKFFRLTKID